MPISTRCPECGRRLKAPDSAAGRRARCPDCGAAVTIPEPVYDAEEVQDAEQAFEVETPGYDETYGLAEPPERPAAPVADDRRPCPVCGEMIRATAVKCRFCGEVFDERLRGSGVGGVDDELIRRFRREVHGVGGLWILFGVLFLFSALVSANSDAARRAFGEEAGLVAAIVGAFGLTLLVFGIGTCAKQVWAMWAGVGLSYLLVLLFFLSVVNALAGGQAGGMVCPLTMMLAFVGAIVQGHRVIGLANRMRRAGVPLTTIS